MNNTEDFIVYNIPAILSRTVIAHDDDFSNKYPDRAWHGSMLDLYFWLFSFFQEHGLLTHKVMKEREELKQAVVRWSDFTVEGQAFLKSLAVDRWMASFDKAGNKKRHSDTSYLLARLKKLRTRT